MALDKLGEALNDAGWTRYSSYVFLVCSTSWFSDMLWASNMSVIMAEVGSEWDLSTTLTGLMSTCFMIGMASGSYLCGYFGDKYGRMYIFKKTPFISIIGGMGQIFSVNLPMLICSSMINGFAIGGEIALGGTVWSEFCPPSKDWTMTVLATTWCLGSMSSACLAVFFILTGSGAIAMWRCVVAVSVGFMIFSALFRLPLRETPRYLMKKGEYDKVNEVLDKVRFSQINSKRNQLYELQSMDSISESQETKEEDKGLLGKSKDESILKTLFSGNNLRKTVVFSIVRFT
jgi:MFS family permease